MGMNKEQFQASLKKKTVLVDFTASWCGPCREMVPVIREIMDEFADKAVVMEIDVDSQRSLSMDYMVQSIPTFILFKDGVEIKRLVGLQPKTAIADCLNAVL